MPASEQLHALRQMRTVAMAMCLVGGLVSLSGVWTTQATHEGRVGQAVVSGIILLLGAFLAVRPVPATRDLRLVAWGAIAGLGVLMATSDPIGMAPFFYFWPVVAIAYFDTRASLAATMAWAAASLTVAVALNGSMDLKASTLIGTLASVGAMALLVISQRERDRRLRDQLAAAAWTDPLTGLLNRRAFDERFPTLIDGPWTFVLMDVDHFKAINDEHGHEAGDGVLQRLAAELRGLAPTGTLLCRHGGEEFVLGLPEVGSTDARALVEHLARRVGVAQGDLPGVTFSYGLVEPATIGVLDRRTVMRYADRAMYSAKRAGRNRGAQWLDAETLAVDQTGTPADGPAWAV